MGDNRVGWALSAERMDELTPTGNLGDPTVATREKGRKLVDEVVDNVTGLVDALAGMDAPGSGSSE